MPPRIAVHRCNACSGRSETRCEEACPGDLMALDQERQKAYCRAVNECWDCMSCVKACPAGAISTKMPYQLGYFSASLRPVMGKNSITWICRDIYGNEQRYHYINRLPAAEGDEGGAGRKR